ncbi:Protein PNS1 [Seminavis robusta]|uniref:Choline transporter-like protein n=1 Tax=Seminavis robusta TaxID=568900 RepID=A0A9N8ERI9_9STRA|nr:Protein PNS1 [Seminavis robusta]|eukprot:Sro1752_g295320.1 Protein PNS1 (597) ;mRNA; f:2315-4105
MMMNSNNNPTKADAVVVNDDKNPHGPGRVVYHMDALEQDSEDIPFVKGEVQLLEYRDVNFARLFYIQLVAVLVTAVFTIFASSDSADSSTSTTSTSATTATEDDDFSGSTFLLILVVSVLAASVGVASFLTLMMNHSEWIVRVSFFAAPTLMLAFGLVLVLVDSGTSSTSNTNDDDGTLSAGGHFLVYAVVFAAISACVYHYYQKFIPFAASTLQVASMAVRSNRGLYLLTAAMPVVLAGWFTLWSTALVGVLAMTDSTATDTTTTVSPQRTCAPGDIWCDDSDTTTAAPLSATATVGILLLLVSFYFTQHVIINVFHTTTAGTVGAWWFTPLADPSLCNSATTDSLYRSLTYSFGSICFGSLIVAIVQTLEHMARSARRNRRGALLACLLECILHCLRRWIEYFNSWAFVYVGLYGYDFLTAGRNVISLFQNRGWSSFVADRLVFRVLSLANLAVAIVSGASACLTDVMAGPVMPPDDSGDLTPSRLVAFFSGFIIGILVSNTALFVMESAVRTVIVCFAESPTEFYECHPDLCELMRSGWAAAYPDAWASSNYESVFMAVEAKVVDDHKDNNYSNNNSGYDSKGTTATAVQLIV